jgi:sodium/hydrogen exchanger-like protein 3
MYFQVLFQMFEGLTEIGQEDIEGVDVAAALGSFLVVTGCGTLIGIIFGFIASLLTRVSGHVPVIQPLLVVIVGYIAFVFAEMFHLSGILS